MADAQTTATFAPRADTGGDGGFDRTLIAVVGGPQETNRELVDAWLSHDLPAALVAPSEAPFLLQPGDVALGRIDVLPSLDGVEQGLDELDQLERSGVRVLNSSVALLRAHDKLLTSQRLVAAGLPHPKTALLESQEAPLDVDLPLVLKPRFGSWGKDVYRCATKRELRAVFREIRDRPWFVAQGALVQELVPPTGYDLRLLVAAGQVVGAVRRVAAPGDWRTNLALGSSREPVLPSAAECRLGIAAAAALGTDFVGVDLLPTSGGYVVIELNGAVEFNELYGLDGRDLYLELAGALGLRTWATVGAH